MLDPIYSIETRTNKYVNRNSKTMAENQGIRGTEWRGAYKSPVPAIKKIRG